MDYRQAIDFIEGASGKGDKRGLYNMERLMERLGNPHKRLRAFHVAGTNGKGSICAFLDSSLRAAGVPHRALYVAASGAIQRSHEAERPPDKRRAAGRGYDARG